MDLLTVIRHRMRAQRLTGPGLPDPVAAVRWSGAVQSQELAEAKWSVVQRVAGTDDAAVQAALDAGEIVRTHVLRPTWHLVAPEDLRWMARLTAPRVHKVNGASYRRDSLDADTLRRTDALIAETLADGEPRIRTELRTALAERGIETPGQRLAHAVMHAELECLIVNGPRRGKQHTYVLAEGRIPDAPDRSREDDLAELVLRYLRSHGPATLRDFAWWSSLTRADAKAGVAGCGDAVTEVPDLPGFYAVRDAEPPPPATGVVRLIPMYDELAVAHQDVRIVRAETSANGRLERPILLDGHPVGSWRRTLAARSATVHAELFTELDDAALAALRAEADRFAASLGLAGELELVT